MMKKYIRKRLIQLIFVIWCITVLTFIMTRISSVDAVDIYEQNTGIVLSDEQKNIMKEQLGLNQPLIQQYVSWISGLIQGDWGRSYVSDQPVLTQFMGFKCCYSCGYPGAFFTTGNLQCCFLQPLV